MSKIQNFKLIQKDKLTKNIYQLKFEGEEKFDFKNGQFITFFIKGIGGRAYSILETNNKYIILIIKKREIEAGGRGGSKFLCELEIGNIIKGIGPAGHFILKSNTKNKLFLGTGTGLVPLYSQIVGALESNFNGKLTLLLGLREKNDIFCIERLEELKNKYKNFEYDIYISNDKKHKYKKGYITSFLNKDNINKYEEYYICGAPSMINNSKTILNNCKILKENIFTEEY